MDDFSRRTIPRFNDAVLCVANAVPDSAIVFRGGSCIYEAFDSVFSGHDYGQTLLQDLARRRIFDTTEPDTTSMLGVESKVGEVKQWKAGLHDRRVLFIAELARITLMGESIRIAAETVRKNTGIPCVPARSITLIRDDADAFRSLLDGMVRVVLEQPLPNLRPQSVGILGYPHVRNEGDTAGDLAELARLVAGLGLLPLPIWLSGAGWDLLARIAEASLLVALPDGVPAAQRLGKATGAPILEAPLPVSLAQTEAWLRALAERTGTQAACEQLLDAELRHIVPRIDQYVRRFLLGRRAVVVASAAWLPGIVQCLTEDLGIEVVAALQRSRRDEAQPDTNPLDVARTFDPSEASLRHHIDAALAQGGLDLVIGSSWERNALHRAHQAIPFVEFGFPQERAHFLAPTPHLGFGGVATWAQRVYEALVAGGRIQV